MYIPFDKFQALENDFLVIEHAGARVGRRGLNRLARSICNRRAGVGADGVLYLSQSREATARLDIYNADGSWAEKSGNGLRMAGLYKHLGDRRRKKFVFEMGNEYNTVVIERSLSNAYVIRAELGQPEFRAGLIPVRTASKYMINVPLVLGGLRFPITCLAVGNPHTVLFVDDFNFDWKSLGAEIETHPHFPHRTNVEFTKVVNRKRLKIAEWERGAGPTGSSGTGAAAAVCAGVMLGLTDRRCRVEFETGSLRVNWHESDNTIELSGPVKFVCRGMYEFK